MATSAPISDAWLASKAIPRRPTRNSLNCSLNANRYRYYVHVTIESIPVTASSQRTVT